MTLNEDTKSAYVEALGQSAQDFLTNAEKLYTPYWNARTELVKSVISLASGSIVLTVTFLSSVFKAQNISAWKYLLFASWLFFLMSIVAAIISFWFLTELRALPTIIISRSEELRQAVEKINVTSEHASLPELTKSIQDLISKSFPMKADRWARRFINASLLAFILALLALGLFGWKQFAV